jgi:hypothetical protein
MRIPILVYAAMAGQAYETAALDAGADRFALKKTPISEFPSSLGEHLNMSGGIEVASPSKLMRKTRA